MEKLAAYIVKKISPLMMWQYLIGQPFVQYAEVKAMFPGGNFPPDAFTIFHDFGQQTTRDGTLARLRAIKSKCECDPKFDQACEMERQLGRKLFGDAACATR